MSKLSNYRDFILPIGAVKNVMAANNNSNGYSTVITMGENGTWVQANTVYNQSDYPALLSQIGFVNASVFTPRTSNTTMAISKVVYGNGLYVYGSEVGYGTSTNALNWSTKSSGTASIIASLTYGNGLYLLTQTSAGTAFVDNGSASAPSYAFNNDVTSGMYLASLHQLGLAANGIQMMLINNSNPADPQISTPAQFNASLISGGTF